MRSLTRTQFPLASPTHGPDMILRDGVPIPTCLHSETTLLIHIETEDIHTHTELPAQRDDAIHSQSSEAGERLIGYQNQMWEVSRKRISQAV